ncbi:MAG: hypothetical protein JOZ38_08950 [Candidatus Eremiobacteraeota bacterium]|nr:hypothetical protein [Candidatus Eremiobacteraeota bacterium]
MNKPLIRSTLAALALSAMLVPTLQAPAKADTTTDILAGAAAVAGILTAVNVEHKHALATTVEGYLPDGSVVYQDGHVVAPNGQSWYPGNYGESVACSNQYCSINGNGYGQNYGYNNPGYNNGYNNPGYNNGYYNNGYYNNNGYYGGNSYQSHRRRDPH